MASLGANLALTAESLGSHRLRAFLTVLGLTMGVATLIGVVTLIQGANAYVAEKIANLGTDVFRVAKTPFATTDIEEFFRARRNPDITLQDARAVAAQCPACAAVGVTITGPSSVRYGSQELRDVSLEGQSANMAEIGSRTLERGRFFTPSEADRGAAVAVIGAGVAEQLFPAVEPLGRMIRVDRTPLRVIGVYERIGSVLGQDQDAFVAVPLGQYRQMRGLRQSLTLEILAHEDNFEGAQDEVRVVLRNRRGIVGADEEDFYIGTAASYIALWETISSSFVAVFVGVSSISALVGGIVIMNIMLVSVTQRTKEIGVRRACGARRRDILQQFLTESVVQCLAGGLTGVVIGFSGALLLRRLADFPAQVSWWVAALGVAFAGSVGLFFGIYPAVRAAELDPVEALRVEQ